ncbi:preprotein translocase subunit SecE [bacterium BMS3Bbin06]|nr:preprotein translocase subunit SecE [bacterium BMS3Abin08]GBE33721.1 preprotein translocase subunit SecE [bacterium BMS3Bbin06]HDO35057.1 preprotein translocase subunit SecE [Nitrospirota bacterium]HDY71944.1 preprotein translocase subunit SecE [Nitrospirota bacterium]
MFESIKGFFRDVKLELKKVVFPSKDELIGSTWVVIISTMIVAVFLGIVDFVLTRFVKYILR